MTISRTSQKQRPASPARRQHPIQQRRVDLRVENEVLTLAAPGQDMPGKRLFEPKFLTRIDSPFAQRQHDLAAMHTVRIEVDHRDYDIAPVGRYLRVSEDV